MQTTTKTTTAGVTQLARKGDLDALKLLNDFDFQDVEVSIHSSLISCHNT